MNPYSFRDLLSAYENVGVTRGRIVIVCGDFGRLMAFEKPGKEAALQAHLDALFELLGPDGTIVVPSLTMTVVSASDVSMMGILFSVGVIKVEVTLLISALTFHCKGSG